MLTDKREMIAKARPYFLTCGKYKQAVVSVPYASKSIDMVLIDKKDRLITVEFEMSNWKRALNHAREQALGADKAYICFPAHMTIPPDLKLRAAQQGIGIFLFYPITGRVETLLNSVYGPSLTNARNKIIKGLRPSMEAKSAHVSPQCTLPAMQ